MRQWFDKNPDTPGKIYSQCASFLNQVDLFNSSFFRISPREAASMDPQQRLLLETAWQRWKMQASRPTEEWIAQLGYSSGSVAATMQMS